MKWVCVASCPCTIQVGGQRGFFELLAVLKSRNEEQLVKSLEAEVGNAPARGDEPLASMVAPSGEDPGHATAQAREKEKLQEQEKAALAPAQSKAPAPVKERSFTDSAAKSGL
eukprot:s48_g11.t1